MPVYSQRQVGITFACVLEDITDPDAPADYDPKTAADPDAPRLSLLFRRPDGLVIAKPGTRASRANDDPGGDENDNNIHWTSTPDDPLIAGYPGRWARSAQAVAADGSVVVASPEWIPFTVV